jgi:hypothetical protein
MAISIFFKKKKIVWLVRGGRSTPNGHRLAVGWLRPPQTGRPRVAEHGQTVALGGGPATPRAISKEKILFCIFLNIKNIFLFFY